jgi:hypothetical protein
VAIDCPPPVTAAPNRCELTGKILSLERSVQFPNKWKIGLEILSYRALYGGVFARVGQHVKAFSFELPDTLGVGDIIAGEGEFLGDPRSGQFQLRQVKLVMARDSDATQ